MTLPGWAAAVMLAAACSAAQAATVPERAFEAELALLAGNARVLADPHTPPDDRPGLIARIRSTLGSLGLVGRTALQADARREDAFLVRLATLRRRFVHGSPAAFAADARRLAAHYPFDAAPFFIHHPSAVARQRGQAIYEHVCAGCHLHPAPQAPGAPPDLFVMARTDSRTETAARFLRGIHGDRTTALENPFSDAELADLIAYFRTN